VLQAIGEIPIVLSAISVAEIGHGIYRANTPELRDRRRAFLDELRPPSRFNP
jgi:predicted nucleic acid-binding protein